MELLLDIIVLFFPLLFVMIYFIYKYITTIKKINFYEESFGVVFTKDVLEDMKGIPPECYNFNPKIFVPEYNENEKEDVTQSTDFFEILGNEEKGGIEE